MRRQRRHVVVLPGEAPDWLERARSIAPVSCANGPGPEIDAPARNLKDSPPVSSRRGSQSLKKVLHCQIRSCPSQIALDCSLDREPRRGCLNESSIRNHDKVRQRQTSRAVKCRARPFSVTLASRSRKNDIDRPARRGRSMCAIFTVSPAFGIELHATRARRSITPFKARAQTNGAAPVDARCRSIESGVRTDERRPVHAQTKGYFRSCVTGLGDGASLEGSLVQLSRGLSAPGFPRRASPAGAGSDGRLFSGEGDGSSGRKLRSPQKRSPNFSALGYRSRYPLQLDRRSDKRLKASAKRGDKRICALT